MRKLITLLTLALMASSAQGQWPGYTRSGVRFDPANVAITGGTITGLSTPLPVASGGTGAATLTGALKGNGTSAFTQAACADLSNGATGCSTATGTSGATIPLLNGTNTWSGTQTFGGGTLLSTIEDTITATGTVQGDSFALDSTKVIHRVTGGASTTGVKLGACGSTVPVGSWQIVTRANSSSAVNVYPAVGDIIGTAPANTATFQAANSAVFYLCSNSGHWEPTFPRVQATANQITVTALGSGGVQLSTPQDIATASNVQFGSVGLGVAASGTSGDIKATTFTVNNASNNSTFALSNAGGSGANSVSLTGVVSSGAAQTGYLCYNTTGSLITYDSGATCLVSREEYKTNSGPIREALPIVMALQPFWGHYKNETPMEDHREQPFLGARYTASVDARLASYDKAGEPLGVRYQNLTAVLVAAIQQQQEQINDLRNQVRNLEGMVLTRTSNTHRAQAAP